METGTPGTTPAPIASPAALPPSAPPPPPYTPQSSFANGGMFDFSSQNKSSSNTNFFKDTNWVELGMLLLGATFLYYGIAYFRYKLKEEKVINTDFQNQLDTHSNQLNTLNNTVQQAITPAEPENSSTGAVSNFALS